VRDASDFKQGLQGGVEEFLGMRQSRNGPVHAPGAFEKPFRFDNQTAPAPCTNALSPYLCTSLSTWKNCLSRSQSLATALDTQGTVLESAKATGTHAF
jgi:hypothetical protein